MIVLVVFVSWVLGVVGYAVCGGCFVRCVW